LTGWDSDGSDDGESNGLDDGYADGGDSDGVADWSPVGHSAGVVEGCAECQMMETLMELSLFLNIDFQPELNC
jgi:hypothetical protein